MPRTRRHDHAVDVAACLALVFCRFLCHVIGYGGGKDFSEKASQFAPLPIALLRRFDIASVSSHFSVSISALGSVTLGAAVARAILTNNYVGVPTKRRASSTDANGR